MKIKKLKLTKTVLRNLTSEDQINIKGGYDSDKLCTQYPCPGTPTFGCTIIDCVEETELCP